MSVNQLTLGDNLDILKGIEGKSVSLHFLEKYLKVFNDFIDINDLKIVINNKTK